MFTYELKLSSFKDLKRLPPDVQKRIIKKLDYFAKTVSPLSFADRLVNHEIGEYRFRIGDYRVIFDHARDTFVILAIGHRREIYK